MADSVIGLSIRWYSRKEYMRGTQLALAHILINHANEIGCSIAITHQITPGDETENGLGTIIRATEIITKVSFMNPKEAVRYKLSYDDQQVVDTLTELNAYIKRKQLTWHNLRDSIDKVAQADMMISLEPTKP